MASKSFLTDVLKAETLQRTNYDMWQRKIQYLLYEQGFGDHLENSMEKPTDDSPLNVHRCYDSWARNDKTACYLMLVSMRNDLIKQFEIHKTAKEMWAAVKKAFGKLDASRIRALTMTFETYKIPIGDSMTDHLRKMGTMIRDLEEAGSPLSSIQQITCVLRSLPNSWDTMKKVLIQNNQIQSFEDLSHHLILESELAITEAAVTAIVTHHKEPNDQNFRSKKKEYFLEAIKEAI